MRKGLLYIFLALWSLHGWSQHTPSSGTEFRFGLAHPLEVFINSFAHGVYIVAHDTATGIIEAPGVSWSVNFSVGPNSTVFVEIPNTTNSIIAENIEDKGIRITASDTVTVYAYINPIDLPAGDGTIIYPVQALDTSYIASMYNHIWVSNTQYISKPLYMVSAICDSTVIEISAKDTTSGGIIPGEPDTIVLNQGENFYIKPSSGNTAEGFDLTGTRFRSLNNPPRNFACYTTLLATYVLPGSSNYCCSDTYLEQMVGTGHWGTRFLNASLPLPCGEVYRIVADKNGTEVSINGSPAFTLQATEYADTVINEAVFIEANKPIDVFTMEQMDDCNGNVGGDPEYLRILPMDQMITLSRFHTAYETSSTDVDHLLLIICKAADTASVTLDGAPVNSSFTPFSSMSDYAYCFVELADTLHVVECPGGFQAYVFGFVLYGSYAHSLGGTAKDLHTSLHVDIGPDTALCSDSIVLHSGYPAEFQHLWSTGSTDTSITIDTPGTYWLWVAEPGNCYPIHGSDTIVVMDTLPPPPFIGNDTTICSGMLLTLSAGATPNAQVTWMDSITSNELVVQNPGTYYVNVTIGNCTRSDTIVVDVQNPLHLLPLADIETCDTGSLLIPAGFSGGTPPYGYKWMSGTGAVLADSIFTWQTMLNLESDDLQPGTYELYVWDSNGCGDSGSFVLYRFLPQPMAFGVLQQSEPAGCDSAQVFLQISNAPDTVIWALDGAVFTGSPSFTSTRAYGGTLQGWAVVFYSDTNGCRLRDSVDIHVVIPSRDEFAGADETQANVFTPNGDGVNDCFEPVFRGGLPDCSQVLSFIVYNRWGVEMFTSTTDKPCWDGWVVQKQAPEGVYYYIATTPASTYRGSLTLIR